MTSTPLTRINVAFRGGPLDGALATVATASAVQAGSIILVQGHRYRVLDGPLLQTQLKTGFHQNMAVRAEYVQQEVADAQR